MRPFGKVFVSIKLGLITAFCAFSLGSATALAYPLNSTPKAVFALAASQREPTLTLIPVKSSLKVLPNTTNTQDPKSPLVTPWGHVSASANGITRTPIQIRITKGKHTKVIYTCAQSGGKKLLSWQTQGQYLLLNFGLTGNIQPTTGDFGGYYTVIDLVTSETVTSRPIGQESHTVVSLSPKYLVVRDSELSGEGNGHVVFIYDIIDLLARQHVTFTIFDNDPFGDAFYLNQDRLFYQSPQSLPGIYSVLVPKNAWVPLSERRVYKLVLKQD